MESGTLRRSSFQNKRKSEPAQVLGFIATTCLWGSVLDDIAGLGETGKEGGDSSNSDIDDDDVLAELRELCAPAGIPQEEHAEDEAELDVRDEILDIRHRSEEHRVAIKEHLDADPDNADIMGIGGVGTGQAQPQETGNTSSSSTDAQPVMTVELKPGAEFHRYCLYDEHIIMPPMHNGCQDVVHFEGHKIGQLQPLSSWAGFSMAVRCKIHRHCSRTRAWRPTTSDNELPGHVPRVLVKWLLDGEALGTKDAHMKLPHE